MSKSRTSPVRPFDGGPGRAGRRRGGAAGAGAGGRRFIHPTARAFATLAVEASAMIRRRLWCLAIPGVAATLVACKVYDSSLLDEPGGQAVGAGGRGGAAGAANASGAGGSGSTGGAGGRGGAASQGGAGGAGGGELGSGGAGGSGATGGSGGSDGGSGGSAGGFIVINELYFNSAATDAGCFIELKGPAGTSLEGYKLQGVNGKPGTQAPLYATLTFEASHALDANGYFVVAQDAGVILPPGAAFAVSLFADLQNGPDNVVLVDPAGARVDAVAYTGLGGTFDNFDGEGMAASGPSNDTLSLSRLPDGTDNNDNATDFAVSAKTPGAANVAAPPPP
jgi:hypothetical protein